MGGFTFMAALATAGILVAIFFAALAVFIVATVISIVFAARTKKRREQGKSLGALIAIPIVLYVLSAPTVLFGLTTVIIPSYIESVTTTYNDCTSAVVKHNPEELERFLEDPSLQVPDDGEESYRSLVRLAIEYGDEECVEVLLSDAEEKGSPVDLNVPLDEYNDEGVVAGAEYALAMATDPFFFSSVDMIQVLLSHDASVNVVDEYGNTPLYNACSGFCSNKFNDEPEQLVETEEAIDVLLEAGADTSAINEEGLTPWDAYQQTIREYEESGAITSEEAAALLSERSETLKP